MIAPSSFLSSSIHYRLSFFELLLYLSQVSEMKTTEFIQLFRANRHSEKQKQMEQYMRNQFEFIGLQATERRALAKDFLTLKTNVAKESGINWDLLFLLWELPEREFQLTGLDYLKRVEKLLVLEDLPRLQQLVLTKSWWDTIDFLAKNIGSLVQKEPQLLDEMRAWSLADNMWMRRVAILHQLSFKADTNHELLSEIIINNINEDEFFIQKAIGWALREYAKTNEQWVRDFVSSFQNELSKLSYREATKNIGT